MLGRIEGRRRRTTEDEMVGWHHQLNEHEFEQTQELVKGTDPWFAKATEVLGISSYSEACPMFTVILGS